MTTLQRAPIAVLLFVAGGVVALCTVLLHDYPWGLVLGVVTTVATLVALPPGWWGRFAFALGWMGLLWRAATETAAGDYLVATDASGYVLLVFGLGVFAAGLAGLLPRRGPDDDSGTVGPAV
jgi:hypothetical protein